MGDFVDRGFYSVETFLLLLALKVSFKIICLCIVLLTLTFSRKGSISWQNNSDPRKSRISSDHSSLWLLRRMPTQVRHFNCLALLYRGFWLPIIVCHYRWKGKYWLLWNKSSFAFISFLILDILCSWWSFAFNSNTGWDSHNWPKTRGSSWRSHVRSSLVWPWRNYWLGHVSSRCWLPLWFWCCSAI